MKKKVLSYLLIALPALLLQSCLHDQEDKFSEASSLRLQEAIETAHKALYTNQTQWVLDYYPKAGQYYGGYSMVLKFDEEKVTAWRLKEEEEKTAADPSIIVKDESSYSMTNNYGPVLTFDTYNNAIHYFSTPRGNSSWYQAMEGDFEFVVDSVGQDKIKLHGKRSQNTMYLRALTEEPVEYLTKAAAMYDDFIYSTSSFVNNGQEVPVQFDLDYRKVVMNPGKDNESSVAFCFTSDGLRFYKPVIINGTPEVSFAVTTEPGSTDAYLVSKENSKTKLPLNRTPGYLRYEEWAGDYTLTYQGAKGGDIQTTTVTLELVGDQRYILAKNLHPTYALTFIYNRSLGTIDWNCQRITTLEDGTYVLMANWDVSAGSVNYTTSYGMRAVWNEDRGLYVWTDKGLWSGHPVSGFIPYFFNSSGTRLGAVTSEYYFGGFSRMIPITFTKN